MAVHVVLFEPEIPQNTGNILRTCVATNTKVHIIRPLGFELNHDTLKRAASNHLDLAEYDFYDSFEDFESKNPGTYFYMTQERGLSPGKVVGCTHTAEDFVHYTDSGT